MRETVYPVVLLLLAVVTVTALILEKQFHKRQMQKLNEDLDRLLSQGIPLPINQYQEGELSILANQMEKITLRFQESARQTQKEKEMLANSMADISHQLRTPLTAMNLTVTMLRGNEVDAGRRLELSAELHKQLIRMEWLIESMLKISKLDAGTIPFEKKQVRVKDLVRKATEPLEIAMELREQTLSCSFGEERFCGDENWSAEALGNLLKNCMEHTPVGGRIMIFAEETPIYTKITVKDSGTGFSEKDMPHLFERFYQGKNAGENSYGIGLALAQAIIHAQNGRIEARNYEGGAEFLIKFYKGIV